MTSIPKCPSPREERELGLVCKRVNRRSILWNADGVCKRGWTRYTCYKPETVGLGGYATGPVHFKVPPLAYNPPAHEGDSSDDGWPWYAWGGVGVGSLVAAGTLIYGIYKGIKYIKNRPPKAPDGPDLPDVTDAAIKGVDMADVFARIVDTQVAGKNKAERKTMALDALTVALERTDVIKDEEISAALASFEDASAFKAFLTDKKEMGGLGMEQDDATVAQAVALWRINAQEALREKAVAEGWSDMNAISDLMVGYAMAGSNQTYIKQGDTDADLFMSRVTFQLSNGIEDLDEMALIAHAGWYAQAQGESDFAKALAPAIAGVQAGQFEAVANHLGDLAVPESLENTGELGAVLGAVQSTMLARAAEASDDVETTKQLGGMAYDRGSRLNKVIGNVGIANDSAFGRYCNAITQRTQAFSAAGKPAGLSGLKLGA